MIDYQPLIDALSILGEQQVSLQKWAEELPQQLEYYLTPERWGDLPHWQQTLAELPRIAATSCAFKHGVRIGEASDCSAQDQQALRETMMALHPWRKGPYELFGLHIETEWRSDWKWDRLLPHIASLQDHLVLDVGCGNGYHCWRMYGEGAHRVIGIDPSPRFVHQFYALKQLAGVVHNPVLPIDILPLGIEDLPPDLNAFDTVFSMGVLYHRRSPIEHLLELKACLKPGGQLVLETLVIEGALGETLVPQGRYAKMRNVWFIPSADSLLSWMSKCGLKEARLVDLNQTSLDEQRTTEWMHFESLADFLNPDDRNLTLEGHPAPKRAIFVATI